MEAQSVPEVPIVDPLRNPDAVLNNYSGKPADFAADIAKIAQEMGVINPLAPKEPAQNVEPTPAPVQPETPKQDQPQATEQPLEVPKKFQNKDGQLDESKLAKSIQSAEQNLQVQEAALARYRSLESELKRKQQEVKKLQSGVGQTQTNESVQPNSFEAQIEADLQKNGVGRTLAKLYDAARQSAYDQARQDLEGVADEIEWGKRQRGLEAVGKNDPWVLSDDGVNVLAKIVQDDPFLHNHPQKWTKAYEIHLGRKAMQQMAGSQVQTPTPTAPTVKAPASPVGAVNRGQQTPQIDLNDPKSVNAFLDKLPAKDQAAWWDRVYPGRRK